MSDDKESLKITLYVIMGIATLGFIFFIVNFIRCRMSRAHRDEYEEEDSEEIIMQDKDNRIKIN